MTARSPALLLPTAWSPSSTLASAQVNEDAWPEDNWWHAYGDPQLDALMSDALAGSPSLQVAQARLREAQAAATRSSAPRLPSTTVNAETSRQRYSANGLYPPPFAGNYYNDGRIALDFSYDLDFWGHNREVLQSARANVRAAQADHAAARLALTVAVCASLLQPRPAICAVGHCQRQPGAAEHHSRSDTATRVPVTRETLPG